MNVLISAYACSPYRGSEPGVGWGLSNILSFFHEVYVITEKHEFENEIKSYFENSPESSKHLHFFFIPRIRHSFLERLWPPSYYWSYRRWHQDAFILAQKLHSQIGFDLAHQLTMVGFREPGYLWQLGVPFIWGPVGGMGLFPWRFLPKVGLYGALYYLCYNLYNLVQMRFIRRPKLAARAAGDGLIAATPENQAGAMVYWGYPSTIISEVGLPREPVVHITARATDEPLRLVWAGLHIPRKALNLGLEALADLPASTRWELHVLGKGRRTVAWQRLAERLGIAEQCQFHGWLARDKALTVMARAHVMLITSLRDLTSTVIIEALALGLPVVCLDHCGFAHVVNDTCGIKVPVTTPRKVVKGLAAAIEKLVRDEDLRQRLAFGALARARDFAWEKKVSLINDLYQRKLSGTQAVAQ